MAQGELARRLAGAIAGLGHGISPSGWILWGGLALALCALYIGVYVWMRRPKFGDGSATSPADSAEEGFPALEPTGSADSRGAPGTRPRA